MAFALAGLAGRLANITTIVSTPADHSMTTLDIVKQELNLPTTDDLRDAVLTRYIKEASRAVENFCNRTFVVETVKDRFFPSREFPLQTVSGGVDPLQLTSWPVTAITSITEDGDTLVAETDYIIDKDQGQLFRLDINLYPAWWNAYPITVDYTAGYATIPYDVSDAVIRMVCGRYFARGRDPLLRSETVPGVWEAQYWVPTGTADNTSQNLPPGVQSLLDNYRVPVVS